MKVKRIFRYYVCDSCYECKYFIDNDDTQYYECLGDKQKCCEFIAKDGSDEE